MWVGIENKSGNVVLLAGNGLLANSTVDKLYRLYADCKDKSSVKTTVFWDESSVVAPR